MHPYEVIAAVAAQQHMAVAAWQCRLAGASDEAISYRVRRCGWRRPHRGVAVLPSEETSIQKLAAAFLVYARPTHPQARVEEALRRQPEHLSASDRFANALVEAAMSSGPMVCGPSAAWLHGLGPRPSEHFIRLLEESPRERRSGIKLRYGELSGGSAVRIKGLPASDVEQCILEHGIGDGTRRERHHRVVRLIANGDSQRKTTVDAVNDRAIAAGRFVGARVIHGAVADLKKQLSHSRVEKYARSVAIEIADELGLTVASRPHTIVLGARLVGEADVAVVEICLDVEVDGPHHLLLAQIVKDRERDRLVRRAGWDVERFSTELIELQPVVFRARLKDAIEHRARRMGRL